MTTKQVTVVKYVACNGVAFDDKHECENYESNLKVDMQRDVFNLMSRIKDLKEEINEARINSQLARLDAEKVKRECAITAMDKAKYCELMARHFRHVGDYNQKRRKLWETRRALSMIIDNQYMWFGKKSRRSSVARLERKRKSDMWRRENTPDKWRTPHKIRVSKLPHPARGED